MNHRVASIKRTNIIEAALVLFADRGFHGTNVPTIAKHANVGTGTIYRYFENKEELVNTVYQIYTNKLFESITSKFPSDASTYDQYLFIMKRLIHFAKKNKKAFIFIETHNHADYLDTTSKELMRKLENFLRVFIARGVKESKLRRDLSPEVLIAIVYGAYVAIFKRIEAGVISDTEELIEGFIRAGWDTIKLL